VKGVQSPVWFEHWYRIDGEVPPGAKTFRHKDFQGILVAKALAPRSKKNPSKVVGEDGKAKVEVDKWAGKYIFEGRKPGDKDE
jgi:hypothetical protein